MKVFSGTASTDLAKSICSYIGTDLGKTQVSRFSDQEIFVEVGENVRGQEVFVIQSTSAPANENLMELLITVDALRRGSAKSITAVVPYYGYARQDRKTSPRSPITARLVAKILAEAGINRLLTLDLHANQIQGFFDVPVDNLYAMPEFVRHAKARLKNEIPLVVSPDVGGVVRARAFAKKLGADIAIIDKRRERANVSEVMNIIGDCSDRHCILIDDMADTAGTLCKAADALLERGAKSVIGYVTHGVFSGPALERIEASKLSSLFVTDSINAGTHSDCEKIKVITMANLLGEAIVRIGDSRSVSSLFD
jgi:ribose-phosphate pyrophosphokinase